MEGRYEEAVLHHNAAHQIAQSLGNEDMISGACSNLAVCYGRLGNARAQIEWADRAMSLLPPVFSGYGELQVVYWKALGHALLKQPSEAAAAIGFVDARLPGDTAAPMWRLWLLMKADVLTLVGREAEAKEFARHAVTYGGDMAPLPNFEGFFTRWAAVLAATSSENQAVSVVTRQLGQELASLAVLDQAEVLAAAVMVGNCLGHDVREEADLLRRRLLEMPAAVSVQLKRLGALT